MATGAENLPAAAGEEYRTGWPERRWLGSADKRAVRMADGALLNRYWDDNDTRVPSHGDDVKPPKAARIVRQPDLCDLRSAAASGWDFSFRWMDNHSSSPPFAPPRLSRSISMP